MSGKIRKGYLWEQRGEGALGRSVRRLDEALKDGQEEDMAFVECKMTEVRG